MNHKNNTQWHIRNVENNLSSVQTRNWDAHLGKLRLGDDFYTRSLTLAR